MSARRKARELVLKCLYAVESSEQDPQQIFDSMIGESGMEARGKKFAAELYQVIIRHLEQIDTEIGKHAQHWDLNRLALVDKNIMRISISELFYMPDIPSLVSINEAIELAKKYSTQESSAFVNGILNAVFQQNQERIGT